MLSGFQRRKVLHFFRVFDADHDGYIERSDLERWANNMATARGAEAGSPEHSNLHSLWMFTWEVLDKVADEDRAELVGPDEWINLTEELLCTDEGYATVMNAIGLSTFDVLDTDGDGRLSLAEWRAFYRAILVDEAMADRVFPLFDTDGDGHISRAETMDRLREFFCSSDSSLPGNWFFGELPDP